jgi:hypothetical protein
VARRWGAAVTAGDRRTRDEAQGDHVSMATRRGHRINGGRLRLNTHGTHCVEASGTERPPDRSSAFCLPGLVRMRGLRNEEAGRTDGVGAVIGVHVKLKRSETDKRRADNGRQDLEQSAGAAQEFTVHGG